MRRASFLAVTLLVLLVGEPLPTGAGVGHTCGSGLLHGVVGGRHVCRPAADLRVSVRAAPTATRVGGTTTYSLTVANGGRRRADRVVLRVTGQGEGVSASPGRGSCRAPATPLRVDCSLGALAPGARVAVTVVVRAIAEGSSSFSARAGSTTRDARPRDNVAVSTTQVTPPDSVRGRGTRPVHGTSAPGVVVVEVDAIGAPLGGDAAGTFFTSYGGEAQLRGRVVCLTVIGNRASVGGVVEESNSSLGPVGSAVLMAFTDGGAGQDTQITYPNQTSAQRCPIPLFPTTPEVAIDSGDFVVTDVRP